MVRAARRVPACQNPGHGLALLRAGGPRRTKFVSPSPAALYKVLPQGWGATYKHGGDLRIERPSEDRARIVGLGLPEAMHTRAFLAAVCGTLGAAFRISRHTGEVTLEPFRPDGGEVAWVVTWKAL